MLQVFLDSDVQALADGAVALLSMPASDPFRTDHLIVGQIGTGAWLEQQLARHQGISANLRISLAGTFVWRMVEQRLHGSASRAPFDPMVVRWAIFDALGQLPDAAAAIDAPGTRALVRHWQDASDTERMILSSDLAALFGRYLAYRRHWLDNWTDGIRAQVAADAARFSSTRFAAHEPWQRWLWQQVLRRLRGYSDSHPFDEFRARMAEPSGEPPALAHEPEPEPEREPEREREPDNRPAQGSLFDEQGAVVAPRRAWDGPAGPTRSAGNTLRVLKPRLHPTSSQAQISPLGGQGGEADRGGLGRIVLFGLLDIAPEQIEMLALMAREQDIIWFAPDPAQGFWQDLVSPRRAAHIAVAKPDSVWLYDSEPAILGEWGRQQRDFLAQLRQLEEAGLVQIRDDALRERSPPVPETMLQALQASVFALSNDPWAELVDSVSISRWPDHSIQVHSAHSLVRQVEVVHDWLLNALDEDPDLEADQIAVFCTDLQATAPLIRAVFGAGPAADRAGSQVNRLPFMVTGLGAGIHPQVQALLDFLSMADGAAPMRSVLSWFEGPVIRQVCGFDDRALSQLRDALIASGARADDLAGTGSPRADKHGWQQGIDRLLLGAFVGHRSTAQSAGVMSIGVADSVTSDSLGHLLGLLDDIRAARHGNLEHRSVQQWAQWLTAWADRWISRYGPDREGLFQIQDAIMRLTESTWSLADQLRGQAVGFAVVSQALRDHLREASSAARPSGAITVAPLGALRHVPFRVTVMIGLDQGAWPASGPLPEYNLMRQVPAFGDLSATHQARGVFLDTLLACQDQVLITYNGHDARTNDSANPARVVTELLDYLKARRAETDAPADHSLTVAHPVQPFSARRFRPPAMPAYARSWHAASMALIDQAPRMPMARLAERSVPNFDDPDDQTQLSGPLRVSALISAWINPARAYLRERGIRIPDTEQEIQSIEPLDRASIHPFDQRDLTDAATVQLRDGLTEMQTLDWLVSHPLLPAGQAATEVAAGLVRDAQQLLRIERQTLNAFAEPELVGQQLAVAVSLTKPLPVSVTGRLFPVWRCADNRWVQICPARQTVRVYDVISAWMQHLLLLSSELAAPGQMQTITPLAKPVLDQSQIVFGPGTGEQDLNKCWADVLSRYAQIIDQPQPLFPRTAESWLSKTLDLSADQQANFRAAQAARNRFRSEDGFVVPEVRELWPMALWREQPPSFDLALKESLAVYGPLWIDALTAGKARVS